MKTTMVMIATLLVGLNASAKTILECTTPGDALSVVKLEETTKGPLLRIIELDGSAKTFKIMMGGLKNIAAGKSDTLVAAKNPENVYGGGIADAALMRVSSGQKSAILSADKMVYILNCGN